MGDNRRVRVLVAGVGNPWIGDLDFGPRFIRHHATAEWPPGVVLEEAAVAAHLFVHRLQELSPRRVVLVACFPRGDAPGTLRRYRFAGGRRSEADVVARLGESVSGVIDLDHLLTVAGWYGALPADTFVVEVEPATQAFGDRLSPQVEARFEPVLSAVRELTGEALEG